jgi:transposase
MSILKVQKRRYTEEFKRDAISLVTEQGYSAAETARSLGINDNLIDKWRKTFQEQAAGIGLTRSEREALKKLRQAVKRLKM